MQWMFIQTAISVYMVAGGIDMKIKAILYPSRYFVKLLQQTLTERLPGLHWYSCNLPLPNRAR